MPENQRASFSITKIGQAVGILSVILSLVFVGFEIRQNTSVARNDAYNDFSIRSQDLLTEISTDDRLPELLSRVAEGALPDDFEADEQLRIRYIQGAAVRQWEGLFRSVEEGILSSEYLEGIAGGSIVNNDFFRTTWNETRNLYPSDFATFFEGLAWNQKN